MAELQITIIISCTRILKRNKNSPHCFLPKDILGYLDNIISIISYYLLCNTLCVTPDRSDTGVRGTFSQWPTFELSEGIRLDPLTQSIQSGLVQSPPQGHARQNDFNNSSAVVTATDSRRHWVQTNTPRDSLGSELEISSLTPQSTPGTGQLYVDGDGARLPRVRKAPYQYEEISAQELEQGYQSDPNTQNVFWFPDLEDFHWSTDLSARHKAWISQESYDQICETFQSTSVTSTHFSLYYNSNFPSINILSGYVHLYLLHFQPIFPFIHAASFNAHSAHWLLILALGAIGSLYYDGDNNASRQCSLAMHEFVRRALLTFVSTPYFLS
jgi:hypothetical protein